MKSKVALVVSVLIGTVQLWSGIFIVLIALLAILGTTSVTGSDVGLLVFELILAAIGIFLILSSRKKKKLIRNFKKYVSIISIKRVTTIKELAKTVGANEDVVRKNIEKMIAKGYFVNAYINHETDSIVIGDGASINVDNALNNTEYITCNCKNCGAMNKIIKNSSAGCDYCGSVLKG